jgi:hypothetical protein
MAGNIKTKAWWKIGYCWFTSINLANFTEVSFMLFLSDFY